MTVKKIEQKAAELRGICCISSHPEAYLGRFNRHLPLAETNDSYETKEAKGKTRNRPFWLFLNVSENLEVASESILGLKS